ncbi:hypothetical protein EJB05_30532 [Eragrostis curvula]|uniref:NB-ARC domain-containing protein n=1 Tax=Eragrostis curvula TaxID=38414 RepID=A0A5J9UBJ9_9POAL|nr:hypothetical protein EJB05_30532 [Eragrostis curvula]
MAELVAGVLVGPLLSLVKQKASNYLLDKYKVMEGMEEQHKILKRKLPAILDIIADAEKQSTHREGPKAWLEELKTVAYEANDVFDEFNYEALRRRAKENGHIRKLGMPGVKLLPTHNRAAFRHRMGEKLRRIVEAIEVLMAEMNTFGFKFQDQALASKQWRQTDSIIVDQDTIVSRSRDTERKEIVQMLTDKTNTEPLTVLPIVGMGGLGKTTLAQLIYNDPKVKKHFEKLIWVCVSDEFDVADLGNKICNSSGEKNLENALQNLQKLLSGKRYLLVLDDVWNKDSNKWLKLKACLQQGGTGSFVLTTTRDNGIAELMGTTKVHNIALLHNDFIKQIIEARAFGSQKRPAGLDDLLVGKIVEKCHGSPLAAKALGSVLGNKTTVKEWEAVAQASSLCNDTDILPILKLSYDDLPSFMKQCFAFCAVFPKDYEIDMDILIKLWMANGFIPEKKGVRTKTEGKWIFNEMVSRSFFQDIKEVTVCEFDRRQGYYTRTICKIHDLMHDVALSVMKRELASGTEESSSNIEVLQNTTRHLHFSCYGSETLVILNRSMEKMCLPIQTLMAGYYKVDDLHHLSKYSSLRALQLGNCSTMLMRPKHLLHLRYLDLSRSSIEELPDDISILYNLQTLDLSGCRFLHRLPKQMKYLTALRHL